MRDKVKRFISILMTALMLVNLLPVGALADGITSIGYKQETVEIKTYGAWVYVYAKLTGYVPGTSENAHGWYTLGKKWVDNIPDPAGEKLNDIYGYGEISGVSVNSVINGMQKYTANENITASAYDSSVSGSGEFGFKVCDGATDYVSGIQTWHLNLQIDVAKIQGKCTFHFKDYWENKTIKDSVTVTGNWNMKGSYTAPTEINYNGFVYELIGNNATISYTFNTYQQEHTFYYYNTGRLAPHTLKIYYYYESVSDKNKISEAILKTDNPYTENIEYGKSYSVTSPTIIGYKPDKAVVTGMMYDKDETVNVIYTYQNKLRYKVKHLDRNGNSIGVGQESFDAMYGETITSSDKKRPIEGYKFDHAEPESIQILDNRQVINLYYSKNTFTIKYSKGDKGADTFKEEEYTAGYGDPTPSFKGKTDGLPGYEFAGWKPAVTDTVTKDEEYVAQWKEKEVAVNYEAEYGDTTEPLTTQTITAFSADGLNAVTAPNKLKDGYAFKGWFKGDDPITSEKEAELSKENAKDNLNKDESGELYADTTFTAKYVPLTSEVKYIVEKDGVQDETPISIQTISVIDGEPLENVTANPIEGYTFDGWYLHTDRIAEGSTLEAATAKDKLHRVNDLYADTTFTAKFVPDKTKTASVLYTISTGQSDYGSIDRSGPQIILQATGKLDIEGGGSVSGSMATANPGYKFVGWYKVTGEETYEKVTDDPELKSELAESELNRDEKTGLYRNTVFVARFELDAGAKVPVTYEAENGTLEGTTAQEAQVVTGEGLTDVTATPNKGYKFDGWYAVDKNGDKHLISGLDPAEELDAKTAKENLNKDGNLYAATTFIARFVPDTKQSAKVIYTTDGNGTLWGGPAIEKTTQHVQIVTGEVVREDGSVIGDKLTTIPTYPKEGYEFDRWIRVFPEKTIEDASSTLTDEKARPNLNQEDGLYQKTEFKAIFKPQTNLSYTVNYYWNGTEIPVNPSKTVLHQTFGAEATESPIGADDYTPVSNEPKKIKIGADSTQNVINFYYYRNVKLTANSDTKTYNGEDQSVSGYTCAVAEKQQDGSVEYVPWTGEKPLIFDGISASGSGKDVNEKGYQVTFNESPIGEHDDLYYVKESQTGTLTITPRQVTLTSETASKPYDGTELTRPVVAVTGDGFVDGEVTDIKAKGKVTHVSEGKMTNTITYTPVDGKFDANNYTITKNEGELWITPNTNEVVVTIEGRTKTVTYNGEEHTAWQYDVVRISDPLYETAPGEVPNFWNKNAKKASGTDAGTYPMGWEAADFENTNTNFSNVKFVVTDGQLVINPRPVVLTSASDKKVYDGEALTNHTVTEMFGTESPFPNGEGLDYDFMGSQTDVGKSANTFTYKAEEGTNTKLTNYAITTEYGTLEVTPVTDRVTVKIKGKTASVMYDGKLHFVFGFDAEPSNALYNPNEDIQFNGTDVDMIAEGTDAGTYTMGLEVSDFTNKSKNFTNVRFEVVEDGKLEIKKRSVKLTSASDEKVYDGKPLTNETVAVGGDGFADGEGATYDFTGSQTDVGESDNLFTFEVNEGTKKENYTFEVAIGTLKVNPVTDKVTVTVTEKSDTVTYDGMPHTVSGYASMTADNPLYDVENDVQETPNAAWAANGTDAGEYPLGIVAGDFKNTNKNFTDVEFVVVDGVLKIDPAPVTLQAPIASKTYDGTPLKAEDYGHSFVEGLDFADDFASISVEGSQTQAGSSVSQIKEVVPKKGKDLKNYKLTFLPGSLTVTKRSVLLTSQSATKTYDGSALTRPAVTITGDGFVPGELAKVEATGSITNVGSTPNAIQYTTTGAFNPANYSIALSVGTLTVTAKPEPEPRRTFNLTVNYVYQNGKRAAASYNRGGLKNGETFDITSPVIAGYTASETVVSGTIDNRDIKVTVIYTADGVNLDDYGVPLGLGNITMNVGDCFE